MLALSQVARNQQHSGPQLMLPLQWFRISKLLSSCSGVSADKVGLQKTRPLTPWPLLGQGTTGTVMTGTKETQRPGDSVQPPATTSAPAESDDHLGLPWS